ncbi:BadF/BadG/BcrA/BcrD ATPase family protein [Desulfonema magnum]|uniref:ATPase domain-containing protein n=1 Tax=Desulfonema magnum TaxID=45655 RepID=A0A975BSE6_9BACT|nr:BadF/BadG/BcrA/BcrD ATPase family protein [Desulfonema magnum]QTA90826.1 ATPase domain-containing protein [Desulfonema magnum]
MSDTHDPGLDKSGPQARKESLILIEETADGTDYATTFTLLLHRSLTGHLKLVPGLMLLGITAIITALFVIYKRRSMVMVFKLRFITQHIMFLLLTYGGRVGIHLGYALPCFNSTCAVFAESEMVSLMAKGISRERIIQGLHESVARRIVNLAGSQDMEDDFYLDGGAANNPGLVTAIEDELFRDIHVLPHPQFTVAYGAARSLETQ